MDVENIFRDVKLSKTEMTVLRFIQNDPEQCIRQGLVESPVMTEEMTVRAVRVLHEIHKQWNP